jgi:ComF family protein
VLEALTRLPSLCAVCRRWSAGRVCADCLQRFGAPTPRCIQCALRLPLDGPQRCGACITRPDAPVQRTIAAVDYAFPWDGLIAGFKFHRRLELAPVLARLLSCALPPRDEAQRLLALPVPLSGARLRERGYNQAWELARRVVRTSGDEARPDVLLRIKDTAHQLGLDETERRRNLRAAFLVDPRQAWRVQGRRVALVDDVLTSGATADEAARALLQAGAREVRLWVVARTPAPGDG